MISLLVLSHPSLALGKPPALLVFLHSPDVGLASRPHDDDWRGSELEVVGRQPNEPSVGVVMWTQGSGQCVLWAGR